MQFTETDDESIDRAIKVAYNHLSLALVYAFGVRRAHLVLHNPENYELWTQFVAKVAAFHTGISAERSPAYSKFGPSSSTMRFILAVPPRLTSPLEPQV